MKKKKIAPKSEFRYNDETNHPAYVFGEGVNNFYSVGITHSKKTFGKKNMPLTQNPKKNDKSKAYIRNGIVVGRKKGFGRLLKGYSFSKEDFPKVKAKIRNYKRNRKHKKSK